jgi:hypothetical protein
MDTKEISGYFPEFFQLKSSASSITVYIRETKVCGESGFRKDEIAGPL